MIKISLYWKCQLLGWGSLVIISYLLNNIIYQDFIGFFYKGLFIFFFGLAFSHLLKVTIIKTGLLKKEFGFQVIYLILLIIIFSAIGTYVWLIVLIKSGIWSLDANIFFYQAYFAYLLPNVLIVSAWGLIYFLVHYVRGVRLEERLKMQYQLQLTEMESKALRAQMNPHFIFNCMNSIKSLIQQKEEDKAVNYLTTFSKLLRTILQNSDQQKIDFFNEIETCKLYTQLESMRFGNKFNCYFNVNKTIDLKSIHVPPLIIQPFIENAIWHGIMPSENGGTVTVSVEQKEENIYCMIEDDGIGREVSQQNKFKVEAGPHHSKGIHLTQSRLDLNNALNQGNASVEIVDKKNAEGKAAGTLVVLTFNKD